MRIFVVPGSDSVYNLFSILVSYISLVIFGGTVANVIFAFLFQMVGKSFLFYLLSLLEIFPGNKQSQSKYVTNFFYSFSREKTKQKQKKLDFCKLTWVFIAWKLKIPQWLTKIIFSFVHCHTSIYINVCCTANCCTCNALLWQRTWARNIVSNNLE